LGDVYTAIGDTAKALQYLRKALNGFTTLRKDTLFLRDYMVANIFFKTGMVFKISNQPGKALRYFEAALDSTVYISANPYEKAAYYLQAGEVLRQMKNLQGAKIYLYEGLRISNEIKHAENLRDACYYLSLVFADEKRYDSAWYYNQQYVALKDSITNVVSKFRTEEIKTVYDINEKNKIIARQTNTRNILIASFAVLLVSLGFLYNRYRLRQKNRYQQELNRQQNDLFNAIAAAQEQERKRIAQDIHDGLGSVLSAAKLKMSEIKEAKPEMGADEKFLTGIALLDEASSELRNISHNIMPATLSKLGLVPALKNLTEKISSHNGVHIHFFAHDCNNRMNEQIEISVYRIILELINNVVKHANATKATVQLVRYPDYINITVDDNGKGFETGRATDEKKGIGLGSVAARVELLKGKMDIDSMPGSGTTVVIDIPILI
jgi:signal transduction histidine kinase